MTTVGHTLAALSAAALGMPAGRPWPVRRRWLWLIAPAASLPDFPLPGWGHHNYEVSHSLLVNVALILMALGLLVALRRRQGRPVEADDRRIFGVVSVAWLSHLALDALYANGEGVPVYWPLSSARLAWPLPWFETLGLPAISPANRDVLLTELVVFGALCLAAWLLRGVLAGRRSP